MYRSTALIMVALLFGGVAAMARADPAMEIESKSRQALAHLATHDRRVTALLEQAEGVLVLPDLVEMGFGVGGEYGEGVLLVDDKPVAYYALAGASFGLQAGVEFKAQVLLFLTRQALIDFRNSQGWEVGVNANVTLLDASAGMHFDSLEGSDAVVGFVFSNEGLMYDLSLEGSRISRIAR
jgi:lipid-binding SYLF domain-containing protein